MSNNKEWEKEFDKRLLDTKRFLADYKDTIKYQKHLDKGTVEQIYWHYGYYMCLKDTKGFIRTLLDKEYERGYNYGYEKASVGELQILQKGTKRNAK